MKLTKGSGMTGEEKAYNAGKWVREKVNRVISRVKFKSPKGLSKKLREKQIMKERKQVSVVENQPIYSDDKSRFFKAAWREEKRQLFFH